LAQGLNSKMVSSMYGFRKLKQVFNILCVKSFHCIIASF
jgi:hypothetical protein